MYEEKKKKARKKCIAGGKKRITSRENHNIKINRSRKLSICLWNREKGLLPKRKGPELEAKKENNITGNLDHNQKKKTTKRKPNRKKTKKSK